jgi:hypothetical protein
MIVACNLLCANCARRLVDNVPAGASVPVLTVDTTADSPLSADWADGVDVTSQVVRRSEQLSDCSMHGATVVLKRH